MLVVMCHHERSEESQNTPLPLVGKRVRGCIHRYLCFIGNEDVFTVVYYEV